MTAPNHDALREALAKAVGGYMSASDRAYCYDKHCADAILALPEVFSLLDEIAALRERVGGLQQIADAVLQVSVTDYFSHRLERFLDRDDVEADEDDEGPGAKNYTAWQALNDFIQPIVRGEDRARRAALTGAAS